MPNERVIEIPWALMQLPQTGFILDVGSCEATYLRNLVQPDRIVHALDSRDCHDEVPTGIVFHAESLLGNSLPRAYYDAILILSTLEHIGLSYYGQQPFSNRDRLALAEAKALLKPDGTLIATIPAGESKITAWYRQYSPSDLHDLFEDWQSEITYWGYARARFIPISESDVVNYSYNYDSGAGAIAGIIARKRTVTS